MTDALVETWQIHNRIHIYLLQALKPEDLPLPLSIRGRTVSDVLVHTHSVRLMWLKAAAPDLLERVEKVAHGVGVTREQLKSALEASGAAITDLLAHAISNGGRVKGFKPHVTAFVGYLISHESHHRGQAVLALRNAGRPMDKKISYGLWEWGTR